MTDTSLVGQVALVTGASRGVGRATALALADRGAHLALVGTTRTLLDDVEAAITARGRQAIVCPADVSDISAVQRVVDATRDRFGRVDVLVNNAATLGAFGSVWDLDPARWQHDLLTNVYGPFLFIRAIVPSMTGRRSGVVINVSSGVAKKVTVARSLYGSSKAALDQLSAILAAEAGPYGVRVQTFYPGTVDTDMQARMRDEPGLPSDIREEFAARQRNGQLFRPEEPAAALAWLATPEGAAWPTTVLNFGAADDRARLAEMPGYATAEAA